MCVVQRAGHCEATLCKVTQISQEETFENRLFTDELTILTAPAVHMDMSKILKGW